MSGMGAGIKINPAINILDARGLPVSIELTVQYKLLPHGAPTTIATWGLSWEDKIVNPVVRNIVRNVVGGFNAEDLPMQRNAIATQIENGIRSEIESLDGKPVSIESVQLREIVLPTKIKEQIEKVQVANQESERVKYEVLRTKQEAEKRAAKATGDAEANRIEAQGRADAVTIEAQAQAKANKLVAQSLTAKLLHLEQIKIQGKFNEALKENKDAKIFLTPGGSTPNIWVDTKDRSRDTAIHK
jgi:regulator of protease activity HflC (stomatin/prohibitin superfamily)